MEIPNPDCSADRELLDHWLLVEGVEAEDVTSVPLLASAWRQLHDALSRLLVEVVRRLDFDPLVADQLFKYLKLVHHL